MNLFEEYHKYEDLSKVQSNALEQNSSPIFSLKKLEWEKSTTKANKKYKSRVILQVASSNNVIVIATNGCFVLRWNLADGRSEPEEIEVSTKLDDSIDHIFIDPTGSHVIISLKNMDNYYLHKSAIRPKKISKLQGIIECVAFDRQNATENLTKTFLVGTSNGMIYEMSLDSTGKEKSCTCVYSLEHPISITSIYFEVLGGSVAQDTAGGGSSAITGGISAWSASALAGVGQVNSSSSAAASALQGGDARLFVMCATSSPTRLYHFIGGPSFSQLFADYTQSGTTSFTELPGDIRRAELYCYGKTNQSKAQNFALMTEMGIYHGSLLFSNSSAAFSGSENVLLEAQLLPFATPTQQQKGSKNRDIVSSHDSESSVDSAAGHLLQKPVSIAVSEFHFLVLRGDRLQIMSRLSGQLVQEELLRMGEGVMLGMVRDTVKNATWLYSTSAIFQITTTAEDRHVWSIYLAKALAQGDETLFDVAFEYSKNKEQKNKIMRAQAEFSMGVGRPERAAVCFAKSGLSFDEVALRLIRCVEPAAAAGVGGHLSSGSSNANSYDDLRGLLLTGGYELTPLRVYLSEVLKTLPLGAKSQRTMLCTWLCEIYLHQISVAATTAQSAKSATVSAGSRQAAAGQLGSTVSSLQSSEAELSALFKDFLRSNKLSLDLSTTFNLIIGRNNRALLLFFAQIVGDYHRVVSIYMTDRRHMEALQVLRDAPFEKVVSLIYKTAPVLIELEPEATVNMLLSKPQLSVSGLLPAILRYSSALDQQLCSKEESGASVLDRDFEGRKVNFAIRLLRECLARLNLGFDESSGDEAGDNHYDLMGSNMSYSNPEPVLFHTLVWLLAKYDESEGEAGLYGMLSHMHELQVNGVFAHFELDFEYILRQCRLYGRKRASVVGLLLLDAPAVALQEALSIDLDLAKAIAAKQPDEDLRKSLWLTVARHVIDAEVDMKRPIALIRESNGVLSIDDLLPHLPDFTEIDFFKDEICNSLESCGLRIHSLKAEMDELAETAESTVKELESMKNRAYSMTSQHQRCEYCVDPLFGKQFYLFPCSHGFHSHCLLHRAPQHLQPSQLSAVRGIEETLRGLSGRVKDSDNRARAQQEALQLELDGYIAADCPLCGFVMIRSLEVSLLAPEDGDLHEARSWDL